MSLEEALAEEYGLRLLEAQYIDFGMWEQAFRVEMDQGRLFAKRFMRKDRPTDRMLRGLELSQRIRERGFPAPRLTNGVCGGAVPVLQEGITRIFPAGILVRGKFWQKSKLGRCAGPPQGLKQARATP